MAVQRGASRTIDTREESRESLKETTKGRVPARKAKSEEQKRMLLRRRREREIQIQRPVSAAPGPIPSSRTCLCSIGTKIGLGIVAVRPVYFMNGIESFLDRKEDAGPRTARHGRASWDEEYRQRLPYIEL